MDTTIWNRSRFLKTFLVCIAVGSFLLWAFYQLFVQAALGSPVECFFMAHVCVVLLIAPFFAADTIQADFIRWRFDSPAASLLRLSTASLGWQLLRLLLISQVPMLCWVFLSTAIAFLVTNPPLMKIGQMLIILSVYSVSAAAVGACGSLVCKDALFGAECAYLLGGVLISGAFLLVPADRYVGNIQPFIAPVLHLNPLIAVCHIFEMDLFRTPLIYELVPIGSFDYANAPWYFVGFWQLLIGILCFFAAWQIYRSISYKHYREYS